MIQPDANPPPVHHIRCRVCQSPLDPILGLGDLYVSDFPNSAGTKLHSPVPLTLTRCTGPKCGLVQLADTTPRDWLYQQYWYRSSVNETMVAELRDVVQRALAWIEVGPRETRVVADIGCNDGGLLAQYAQVLPPEEFRRTMRVGWEPARNLYDACRPHASVLFPEYFHVGEDWPVATRAKVVTSIAMFYDLDDPHAFVAGVAKILHPEGVWVIQQAYLPTMLANTDFPNVCHEHLEYYSLSSLQPLLAAHGLEVRDVELRAINGGSFRVYVQGQDAPGVPTERVHRMREEERLLFQDARPFTTFAAKALQVKEQLREVVGAAQQRGPVDLYAASTKGNTLLQYCQLDARDLRQCWERSPEKVGRYVGTSAIPIVGEAEGRADPPAALLVGAWTFREAFLVREAEYLKAGGRIILPLPEVEVVDGPPAQ